MARDDVGDEDAGTDRAAEGLAHLQAAARELIAAARAMLDVAEELVEDPKAVSAMVDAVGGVVGKAVQSVTAARPAGGAAADDGDTGYERIRLG